MEKVIVVRKGERVKTVALEGIQFELLLRTDKLEALFCTFEPGAFLGPPYTHIGQEVHLILRGEMEGEIGGGAICLRREMSSGTPQRYPTRQKTLEKKKQSTSLL